MFHSLFSGPLRVTSQHSSPLNTCSPSPAATNCPMARRRRADSTSNQSSPMTVQLTGRRRSTLRDLQSAASDSDVIVPKVINAAPSLEKAKMYGIDDERPASSRMMALAGRIFIETIPQWLAVGGMMGLIFGGCCSNVSDCSFAPGVLTQRLVVLRLT